MKKRAAIALLTFLSFSLSTFTCTYAFAAEDSWETMAQMSTARSDHGVAVVNGIIYAIGGSDGLYLNCTEAYDPATDTWTTKASMPTKRASFATAVYQDRIYVIGGWGASGLTGANEVYDPLSDTWETKTSMSTARTNVVANQVNGKIYVMAGKNFTSYAWPVLCNQTEIYDPLTDSWTTGAPMPDYQGIGPEIADESEHIASVAIDTKIYVIVEQKIYIYDTETDVWSYGADLPHLLACPAACATTGTFAPKRVHAVGSSSRFVVSDLHYIYDPEADDWTSATPISTSRNWVELAVVDDILYAIGGGDSCGEYGYESLGTTEKYTPVGYIPEFPASIAVPLLITTTFAATLIYKRKHLKKPN